MRRLMGFAQRHAPAVVVAVVAAGVLVTFARILTTEQLNDVIDGLAFWAFWALLFVGTVSVLGRVAFYRAHRFPMPRLLVRDAFLFGGFALSFGLILLVRAAGITGLGENTVWKLITDTPAVTAVAVFVYFELRVIERGRDDVRDPRFRQ